MSCVPLIGWFYVKAPPAERSMLIGTFGTNDDVTLYSSSSRLILLDL